MSIKLIYVKQVSKIYNILKVMVLCNYVYFSQYLSCNRAIL